MSECNCKSDIEARLLERFKTTSPEATDHGVTLQGYALVIVDNRMGSRPYMPFKTTASYPLKKGGSKVKVVSQNMMFNYCPFCGKSVTGDPK